jgi:hypothetical protein
MFQDGQREGSMKASEIEIGGVYTAKVSGKLVPVRVLGVCRLSFGGAQAWRCRNELTNREITVRSCQRFRAAVAEVRRETPST